MPGLHYNMGNRESIGHRIVAEDTPHPNKGPLSGTSYKKHAIKAAKNLLYGTDVIESLENAKTDAEITRIMKTARKRSLE